MRDVKVLLAELLGTFILMLGGPGVAVLVAIPGGFGDSGNLAVSLGFGLALLVVAYTVGPISGGHVNPAVTIALLLHRKIDVRRLPSYLVGQVLGGVLGAVTIWAIASNASEGSALGRSWDGVTDTNFATNMWSGDFMGFWPMAIAEILLTALLVIVVLSTTEKNYTPAAVGLHVGMALTLIHLISIPIDNTSVNPVRSFAMAIFAGGDSLGQLWAFVVFPLVGSAVGAVVWAAIQGAPDDEGASPPSVRAAAARATSQVREAASDTVGEA